MPPRDAGDQIVVEAPPDRPRPREPFGGSSARRLRWPHPPTAPILIAILASVALAGLSAALLPTVPSYDPWAWIVWGREVFDPHLSFAVGGGPSWKPLPVIFTAVFGLFGNAAPTLWVITARAAGLLALVAAWRLAARLMGGGRAGAFAGGVAALGVLLTQDWFYYMFRGTSEPMLVASSLWAVDRLLAGRRGQAFALAIAGSLIRPEWWPFALAYAVWLWRREPRLRALVALGLLAIPFFWFVPPWIGSGQPLLAATHAKDYNGHLGAHPLLTVLRRGADLQLLPALIAALIAVAISWWRERDRTVLALAAGALAWWVLVVAMTLDGYPGLERFYLPAAGVTCVLAGVGVARLALLAGGSAWATSQQRLPGSGPAPASAIAVAVAALAIGVSIPFTASRIDSARSQKPAADRAVRILDQLGAATAAVGGHAAVYPCRSSFAAVNHGVQTALAWKLHVTLGRVGTTMRHPGLDFIGPHNVTDGAAAPISSGLTAAAQIAHVGVWRVLRVVHPGRSQRCVGS